MTKVAASGQRVKYRTTSWHYSLAKTLAKVNAICLQLFFSIWLKCWLQHILSQGKPWFCDFNFASFLMTRALAGCFTLIVFFHLYHSELPLAIPWNQTSDVHRGSTLITWRRRHRNRANTITSVIAAKKRLQNSTKNIGINEDRIMLW